jgi:hypothetical protein
VTERREGPCGPVVSRNALPKWRLRYLLDRLAKHMPADRGSVAAVCVCAMQRNPFTVEVANAVLPDRPLGCHCIVQTSLEPVVTPCQSGSDYAAGYASSLRHS